VLGAIIDPANMQEGASGTSVGSVPIAPVDTAIGTAAATALMISSVFGAYGGAAIQIANCESGMNTNAVNATAVSGSNATGLFQILYPSTWKSTSYAAANPKDAMTNIKAAYEIFKRDGYSWREWACAQKVGLV
jgi:hypothetical protein